MSLDPKLQAKYDALKKIVKEHQHAKIDGVTVDATTANMLVQILDKIKPENQVKMLSMPMKQMADIGWKLVSGKKNEGLKMKKSIAKKLLEDAIDPDITDMKSEMDDEIENIEEEEVSIEHMYNELMGHWKRNPPSAYSGHAKEYYSALKKVNIKNLSDRDKSMIKELWSMYGKMLSESAPSSPVYYLWYKEKPESKWKKSSLSMKSREALENVQGPKLKSQEGWSAIKVMAGDNVPQNEEELSQEVKDKIMANNDKMTDLKKNGGSQEEIDRLEKENDDLNGGNQTAEKNESSLSGTILWTSDRDGNGIIKDMQGHEYYFDKSTTPVFAKLKRAQKVSFEGARLKPDNILVARNIKIAESFSGKSLAKSILEDMDSALKLADEQEDKVEECDDKKIEEKVLPQASQSQKDQYARINKELDSLEAEKKRIHDAWAKEEDDKKRLALYDKKWEVIEKIGKKTAERKAMLNKYRGLRGGKA